MFEAGSPRDAVVDRAANDMERDSSPEEASRSDAFLDGADAAIRLRTSRSGRAST